MRSGALTSFRGSKKMVVGFNGSCMGWEINR